MTAAMVRGTGRSVFADVTNVKGHDDSASAFGAVDNASNGVGCGSRSRASKAVTHAVKVLPPSSATSGTLPAALVAVASSSAVSSYGPSAVAVVAPPAPMAVASMQAAELTGRLQAVAIGSSSTSEFSDASSAFHGQIRSTSASGHSSAFAPADRAGNTSLRATRHAANGRGARRPSPGVRRASSGIRRVSPGSTPGEVELCGRGSKGPCDTEVSVRCWKGSNEPEVPLNPVPWRCEPDPEPELQKAGVGATDDQTSPRLQGAGACGGGATGSRVPQQPTPCSMVVCSPEVEPVGRTQLPALFKGCQLRAHVDDQIDVVLAELADEVLQASHRESQRHLPSAEDVFARLASSQRESILDWLVQACDIMRLSDNVLYSTVLTLDRYCAASREPQPMEKMQKVLMAVICTVIKTCAVADEVVMPLRDLLLHLCRRQVDFNDILLMEHEVLKVLSFSGLSAPTPLDFLEALGAPLASCGDDNGMVRSLANFLVQLSLFNAALHYRYPHAVLAAAGLYVALCTSRCSPVIIQGLLHDVATICPEFSDIATRVVTCATELHALWLEFAAAQGQRVPCLLRKFCGSRLQHAVLVTPPGCLVPAASPPEAWQRAPTRSPGATVPASSSNCSASRLCTNCGRRFLVPSNAPESAQCCVTCPNCHFSQHATGRHSAVATPVNAGSQAVNAVSVEAKPGHHCPRCRRSWRMGQAPPFGYCPHCPDGTELKENVLEGMNRVGRHAW